MNKIQSPEYTSRQISSNCERYTIQIEIVSLLRGLYVSMLQHSIYSTKEVLVLVTATGQVYVITRRSHIGSTEQCLFRRWARALASRSRARPAQVRDSACPRGFRALRVSPPERLSGTRIRRVVEIGLSRTKYMEMSSNIGGVRTPTMAARFSLSATLAMLSKI